MLSDQTVKLINLLNEGKSANEICSILNLSNRQLFSNLTNLRNKGILYRQRYYSNGVIRYADFKNLNSLRDYYEFSRNNLITPLNSSTFRCLCISDLHFGSSKESLDLVNRVFNYSVNNGIHIILCCGDLIDGTFNKEKQDITDVLKQVEYFIDKYPLDKNILTFGVAGNHDFSALNKSNQSIVEALRSYRHDVIIGDFNNYFLNIKNDSLHMFHFLKNEGENIHSNSPIMICGHFHKFKTDFVKDKLRISVPSLSFITDSMPSAIDMELTFDNGLIKDVLLKQISFNKDKSMVLNEIEYHLNRDALLSSFKYIKNEEEILDEDIKETLDINQEKGSSQIEKFYKKYNLKP